jgi:hypothetical protein
MICVMRSFAEPNRFLRFIPYKIMTDKGIDITLQLCYKKWLKDKVLSSETSGGDRGTIAWGG